MTTEAIKARKTNLETVMLNVTGERVELTIRGPKKFTFSTDHVSPDLGEKIAAYFDELATVETLHDDECGTCVYVDVK